MNRDGSRGRLPGVEVRAHSSASLRNRVGTPSGLSQQGLSQAKLLTALRAVAHNWRGSLVTIGVLLIWGGLVAILGGI